MSPKAKKLLLISATFTPVTETRKEVIETAETAGEGKDGEESKGEYPNFARVPCIQYPITFRKKFVPILAFFDLGSEVNAIYPHFV